MNSDPLFDPTRFAARVTAAMQRRRLTLRAAAKTSGCDQATFHRVTTGKPPSVETYLRIMRWLRGR
jgi:predicted transcriptional regulator